MSTADLEKLQKLEELLKSNNIENPTKKKVLDLIEAAELSDEMKEDLRSLLTADVPQVFGSGSYLGLVFILIFVAIILFFGYKLYKSLKEKEKKREEKKKAKQMKKKK